MFFLVTLPLQLKRIPTFFSEIITLNIHFKVSIHAIIIFIFVEYFLD